MDPSSSFLAFSRWRCVIQVVPWDTDGICLQKQGLVETVTAWSHGVYFACDCGAVFSAVLANRVCVLVMCNPLHQNMEA